MRDYILQIEQGNNLCSIFNKFFVFSCYIPGCICQGLHRYGGVNIFLGHLFVHLFLSGTAARLERAGTPYLLFFNSNNAGITFHAETDVILGTFDLYRQYVLAQLGEGPAPTMPIRCACSATAKRQSRICPQNPV